MNFALSRLLRILSLFPTRTASRSSDAMIGYPQADTVILGGGFSGMFTAYFLATARHRASLNNPDILQAGITVIDSASHICAGASSHAEGALGDFGYERSLQDLAVLSDRLHKELATQHDGGINWDFAGLDIHAVFLNSYSDPHEKLPFPLLKEETLEDLPKWLNASQSWNVGLMAKPPQGTRLDPIKYCDFLYRKCQQYGVKFMLKTTPVSVAVSYQRKELEKMMVRTENISQTIAIPCRKIVVATGSWSARVFSSLFPHSSLSIPMVKQQPSQTWLRLRILENVSQADNQLHSQVWLNEVLEDMNEFHISTFCRGEFYVAGDFDPPGGLPDTVQEVIAHQDVVDKLFNKARQYLNAKPESIEIVSSGRAYLPQTANNLPILTKVVFDQLLPNHGGDSQQHPIHDEVSTDGVLFINTGQFLNGVALGPGCGKVISELVLGQQPSVDTSPFRIPSMHGSDE